MSDPTVGAPEPAPVVPERIEDDPTKPYKAYAATALTAIGAFLAFWIADEDPFTAKDAGQALLAALVASGLTGGATFAVANPKRVKPLGKADARRRRNQRGESYIGLAVGVLLVVILVVVLFRLL